MNSRDISSILAKMKNRVEVSTNVVRAETFKEKFGTIAEKFYNYSKTVLELEGITETPVDTSKATATDLMIAKTMATDIVGGGWEGSGQGIMKLFSLFFGRNLNSKEVGLTCTIRLPKFTIVKLSDGSIGITTENSNLMVIKGNTFVKHSSFRRRNQEMNVASLEEITIFIGTILSNEDLLRSFSSSFKVSSVEEVENAVDVSMNGINMQDYDGYEYKKFMADLNPEVSTGVAV